MIDGERQLTTSGGYTVTFSDISTIVISKDDPKNDEYDEVSLDPTDLSVIYGAYIQMVKEREELKKLQSI